MKTGNFSGTVDKDMTVHANGSTYKLIIRAQIPDIIRMEPASWNGRRGPLPTPKTIHITISKELPVNLTTVDLTGDAFDYEPVTVQKGRNTKSSSLPNLRTSRLSIPSGCGRTPLFRATSGKWDS